MWTGWSVMGRPYRVINRHSPLSLDRYGQSQDCVATGEIIHSGVGISPRELASAGAAVRARSNGSEHDDEADRPNQ